MHKHEDESYDTIPLNQNGVTITNKSFIHSFIINYISLAVQNCWEGGERESQ